MPEETIGSIDMSDAKSLEPIPAGTQVLLAISKFAPGTSATQNPTVKVEYTVVDPPQYAGRKLFDTINLENANTKGRLKDLLIAAGENPETIEGNKKYTPPDDMVGRKVCTRVKIDDKNPAFGAQNRLGIVRPESAYTGEE